MIGSVATVPDSATPSAVISVIVPAHQATLYLAECLESILAQTRMPDEVIVVDDGSTDDTATIASGFGPPVRVISTPHAGEGAARNTGITAAAGNVIALCDADDLWLPDKLSLQLDALGDPSAEAAVFCGASEFLSPEIDPAMAPGRAPVSEVARARMASALMVTTAALRRVGPFGSDVVGADWVPWCVALTDEVPTIGFVDRVLVRRRIHAANHSLQASTDRASWSTALRSHLAARRREQQ